jgi:hypothetical protein
MRMMMTLVLMACVTPCLVSDSPHLFAQQKPAQPSPTAEQVAVEDAKGWLGLVDSGQYEESWKTAAEVFKASVTTATWTSAMKTTRDPLGKLQSRKLQSATYTAILPGVPDGNYVVILYETVFEHKATAQETVIMVLEKDKVWRVAGYYIK